MSDNSWSSEGQQKVLEVTKSNRDVWIYFLHWLRFPGTDLARDLSYSSGTFAIKCIVFADKYNIPAFHDMAMEILHATKCVFPVRLIEHTYNNTCEGNPVREFLIQRLIHAKGFNRTRVSKWDHLSGTAFYRDILKYMVIERKPTTIRQRNYNEDLLNRSRYGPKKSLIMRAPGFLGV
jgi:hypothetical protein